VKPWHVYAGVGAAWVALVVAMHPGGVTHTAAKGWMLVEGKSARLAPGTRYRACVRVPWYVPTSLILAKLEPRMRDRGFRDVIVSLRRPKGWPEVTCDLFVEATWSKEEPETFARPAAIPFAWRQVA